MGASESSTLDRLYSLRELYEMGYGFRHTISKFIHEGRVPAIKVGNSYQIRESDLHLLGEWTLGDYLKAIAKADFFSQSLLGERVKAFVDLFPYLSTSDKITFRRALTSQKDEFREVLAGFSTT